MAAPSKGQPYPTAASRHTDTPWERKKAAPACYPEELSMMTIGIIF